GVTEPGTHGWHTPRLRDRGAGGQHSACACCAPPASDPALWTQGPDACCREESGCSTCAAKAPAESPAGSSVQPRHSSSWIMSVAARRCHGLSTTWIGTGAVLGPPPVLTWSPYLVLLGRVATSRSLAVSLAVTPPDPPPRDAGIREIIAGQPMSPGIVLPA